MRNKIIIIIILGILVTFLSGITYSLFNSKANMISANQGIASFIFEANTLDHIDLDLNGLVPGDAREYLFSVTNKNLKNKVSDVTIEYKLILKTYHFMPLTINLYKVGEEDGTLIGSCDEKSGRNANNELICAMPFGTLENELEQTDDYKLVIEFPIEYNDVSYANLVDYISIEIESWQKIQKEVVKWKLNVIDF